MNEFITGCSLSTGRSLWTKFLAWGLALFVFLPGGLGVMSAWGQQARVSVVYADVNAASPKDRLNNCADSTDPCSVEEAFEAAENYGGVMFPVSAAGEPVVISGDHVFDRPVYLRTYYGDSTSTRGERTAAEHPAVIFGRPIPWNKETSVGEFGTQRQRTDLLSFSLVFGRGVLDSDGIKVGGEGVDVGPKSGDGVANPSTSGSFADHIAFIDAVAVVIARKLNSIPHIRGATVERKTRITGSGANQVQEDSLEVVIPGLRDIGAGFGKGSTSGGEGNAARLRLLPASDGSGAQVLGPSGPVIASGTIVFSGSVTIGSQGQLVPDTDASNVVISSGDPREVTTTTLERDTDTGNLVYRVGTDMSPGPDDPIITHVRPSGAVGSGVGDILLRDLKVNEDGKFEVEDSMGAPRVIDEDLLPVGVRPSDNRANQLIGDAITPAGMIVDHLIFRFWQSQAIAGSGVGGRFLYAAPSRILEETEVRESSLTLERDSFVTLRLEGDVTIRTSTPFGSTLDDNWNSTPLGANIIQELVVSPPVSPLPDSVLTPLLFGKAVVEIGDAGGPALVVTADGRDIGPTSGSLISGESPCDGPLLLEGRVTIVGDVTARWNCPNTSVSAVPLGWSLGTFPGALIPVSSSEKSGKLTVKEGATLNMGVEYNLYVNGDLGSRLGENEVEEYLYNVTPLVVEENGSIEGGGSLVLTSHLRDAISVSREDFSCARVMGRGALDIDVVKSGDGAFCLDVSRFGRVESRNDGVGGAFGSGLYVMGDVKVTGDFFNDGYVRTEFWGETEITGDLSVVDETDVCDSYSDDDYDIPFSEPRDYNSTGSGVYLFTETVIRGDVNLLGPASNSCFLPSLPGGLQFVGDAEPGAKNDRTALADISETKVSVIEGDLVMEESALVHLGSYNFFHNLQVEGDISMSGDSEFELASAFVTDPNLCTTTSAVTAGNDVTLSGDQATTISGVVRMEILTVEKEEDATVTISDSGSLQVSSLHLLSGMLVTNGSLTVGSDVPDDFEAIPGAVIGGDLGELEVEISDIAALGDDYEIAVGDTTITADFAGVTTLEDVAQALEDALNANGATRGAGVVGGTILNVSGGFYTIGGVNLGPDGLINGLPPNFVSGPPSMPPFRDVQFEDGSISPRLYVEFPIGFDVGEGLFGPRARDLGLYGDDAFIFESISPPDPVRGFLAITHSEGEMTMLSKGSGEMAYDRLEPRQILYVGDADAMSGDEVVSSLERIVVLKPDGTSITLNTSVEITESIELVSGEIMTADGVAVMMGTNAEARIGNGTIGGDIEYVTEDGKIDLLYNGTEDRLAGAFFPAVAAPEDAVMGSRVRNVTVDAAGCTEEDSSPIIALNEGFAAFSGYLRINSGALDVNRQHLVHHVADVGTRKDITVQSTGYLCDSSAGVACATSSESARRGELADAVADALALVREADTDVNRRALQASLDALRASQVTAAKDEDASMIHFVGNGDTKVSVTSDTTGGNRRVDLPRMIVKRQRDPDLDAGTVTLAIENAAVSTATGEEAPNMIDMLGTAGLTIEDGNVVMDMSVDVLDVTGKLVINSDSFEQESRDPAAEAAEEVNEPPQTVRVGMDYTQRGGDFIAEEGGNGAMWVMGNFTQGAELDDAGMDPGASASFDLNGGMHTVMGDFLVGANEEGMDSNTYLLGGMCGDMAMDADASASVLTVAGDYTFNGSSDSGVPENRQGLQGRVEFMGSEAQEVFHRDDPAATFCDVQMNGAELELMSNVKQNAAGRLTLEKGVIGSDGDAFSWMLLNSDVEENLSGRVTVQDNGVVLHALEGSARSRVGGVISRRVHEDNVVPVVPVDGEGNEQMKGGYLFPVGTSAGDGEDAVNAYRPLILQFVEELGETDSVTVSHTSGLEVEWPDDGIAVDGDRAGSLLLDAVADMYWRVEFDQVPARNLNLRLAAEGLANVFDPQSLRIVQWDCDGMNPSLAGVYNLQNEGIDGGSFSVNGFLNGVPNLTQEDVGVTQEDDGKGCNYFGIASNQSINPIHLDPLEGSGLTSVQFIHNVVGGVADVYLDGTRVLDDWTFQSATEFMLLAGDVEHTVELVNPEAEDNSAANVLFTGQFTGEREKSYVVIAHGSLSATPPRVEIRVAEDVRQSSAVNNNVDFFIVHGALDLGQVDIRLLDPTDNSTALQLLANNMSFDDVGEYISLASEGHNFEIITSDSDRQVAVWRLELGELINQAFVLNLSGSGMSSAEGLTIMGVRTDGEVFFPSEITATEELSEVPTEFALEGNYPNPFNPSTRIQFDLPETAEVTVEVIDVLGRTVLTVSPQQMEAGSARTIELNASALASGTYLYRLIAVSAAQTHVKSGRMMLIK